MFRCLAVGSSILFAFAPVIAAAQSAPPGTTQIIPDGRTATTVTTSGSVTNVTTNTVSGPNAFNSFSHFRVGSGNTANLQLPGGTSNLINLVRDSPVVVDGILNAYKNGQIGGNVYFADPHGFVVGKGGVVNVGTLNVSTPSKEFMDGIISPSGQINHGAAQALMSGNFPLSPNGNISIKGRVNAIEGARLVGQNVYVGGGRRDAAQLDHASKFASTVNSTGLRSASGIVVRNGSIQIVAGDSARINGKLTARSQGNPNDISVTAGRNVTLGAKAQLSANSRTGTAGNITVKAANDIAIAANAGLSARSRDGKGGNIIVFADGNTRVASGARIDVSSRQGDAGFVELSAKNAVTLGVIKLDLSARNGKAGTLLIDPTDLVIDGGTDSTTSTTIVSNGGNVILTASNSITVTSTGVIDTRLFDRSANGGVLSLSNPSTGDSGTVSLTAPEITIAGQILTNVINTAGAGGSVWSAGDVALTATVTKTVSNSSHTADTRIAVSGEINAGVVNQNGASRAGDIALRATSTSTNFSGQVTANSEILISGGDLTGRDVTVVARSIATSSFLEGATGFMALVGETLAASFLGINGGYVAGTASAKVTVEDRAAINATRDVTLTSYATETASNPAMSLFGLAGSPLGASAVVGAITSTVQTMIDAGVTIHAGRDLAISAKNEANLAVAALVATTAGIVDATVAYSKVRVSTSVDVASGADISAAKVTVLGLNTNSFSTSATAFAFGSGSLGGAVAYSDVSTSVTANFGASLGSSATPMSGSLSVEAFSDTQRMITSASTQVGNNAFANGLGSIEALSGIVGTLVTPLFGSELGVKGGAALALTSSNQVAQASIGGGAGSAPSIYAGDVSVISRVVDSAIRNNAAADVGASNTSQDAPSISVAAGVAYGTYRHESTAFIGHGVSIDGRNIGVSAMTDLPNENTWLQNWTTGSVGDVLSHLNGNAGTVNNILTSYANNSAGGSSNLSVAGSVNFFAVTNDTTAWVATDARLTQSNPGHAGACSNSTWCTQQSNGDFLDWNAPVSVTATTITRSIDIAGNFGIFSLTGTSSDGSGVGGSLNLVFYDNTTIAGIARGATVSSDTQVAVSAWTNDVFFALAPTSGVAAGSLSLNGVASYAGINNTTHASIDNLASVSAPTISVKATENLQLMSLSGAVTSGGTAGVGLSNAVLDVTSDTKAYIGANEDDRPVVAAQSSTSAVGSHFNADNLTVYAVTTGQATVASIAAAESDPASEGKTFAGKISSSLQNAGSFASPSGLFNIAAGINAGKTAVQNVADNQPPSFSIDIAGSTAATVMALDTTATVNGATIDRFTQPAGQATPPRVNVDVEALNNTFVAAGSGAAALNFHANPDTTAVAVAGSIAVGVLNNATTASLTSSTVTNAGDVTVRALASGEQTLVGLGLAVAASAGQNSGAASLSASVGLVTDSVNASIANSSITGVSGGSGRDVVAQAYQTTDIGVGAGALYAGVKGGVGISLTYVTIDDPSGRHAADAHLSSTAVTNVDTLTVSAADAARISSGAATAGGQASNDGTGLTGAIVINAITPTISAAILDNQSDQIRLTGNLAVTASGTRNATLDAKIANDSIGVDGAAAASGSGTYDFAGTGIVSGGTGGGAAIVAVAGQLQFGGSNFGAAVVSNTIAQTYIAQIGTSDVDTGSSGDVFVTANDTSKIIAVAVGLAISSGQYAGTGSLVINQVNDSVSAQIGGTGASTTNTIVRGRNIAIASANSGSIEAAAGTATFAPQATAFGIASVTNTIGNTIVAAIDGGTVTAGKSVVLDGGSTVDIHAIALGGAWGQNFGAAGSVATNLLTTNVTARIASGADVTADNNVGVLAANTDTIRVIAGAAAASTGSSALGASVVVNTISGTTQAYVSGAATKVDAKGSDLNDDLLVNKGQLVHAMDAGTVRTPSDSAPDLSEMQQAVNGLAIVASSHQAVVTNALSIGLASSVAAGLTSVANLMGGTTKAYVDGAAIDTRLTAGAHAPQIELLASSFSYAGNFALGSAAGGSSGGGAAAVGMRMDRDTHAYMNNATVGSVAVQTNTTQNGGTSIITRTYVPVVGNVRVRAVAEQDASNIVTAGGLGGSAGVAASGSVTLYNADTQAYVTGSRVTAQSLAVTASSTNGLFAAMGAGAIGGAAGVGAAFSVTIANNNTLAHVGEAGVTTMVNLTGALTIQADSDNIFDTYAVGGADGGSAGVAGMANVTTLANTTVAGLYNTYVSKQPPALSSGVAGTDGGGNPTSTFDYTTLANNPDKLLSAPAGNVTVDAHEDIGVFQKTGALANGVTAGVGAGINVVIIRSGVTAEIASSDIVSSGTVAVSATSARSVETWAATTGAGLSAGIGAAVGVIIIGNNSSDPADRTSQNAQAGGTVTAANSFAASTNIAAPATSLGGDTDGITARITGGTITAQAASVGAVGEVKTESHVYGAGFAMTAAVGAAVGYTSVTTAVQASVSPVLLTANSLTMNAAMRDQGSGRAVDQQAIGGGGALVAALGAAVSVAKVNNSVSTTVGGVVHAGTINSTAVDSSSMRATTGGGGGAIVSIGASVAQATKSSHVDALIADSADIVGTTLSFKADESGKVLAEATAASGGIITGNGASAKAFDNGTVTAVMGAGADVAYNNLTLAATAAPEVEANALGVVVTGIGVGASIAEAKGDMTVTAGIGDGAQLRSPDGVSGADGAKLTATVKAPASGTSARADSIAAAGGVLIGVAATVSTAEIDADVTAYIGKNVTLRGGMDLKADNTSSQWASTIGVVAGTVAAGGNAADAISHGATRAYVDDGLVTNAARIGALSVIATGTKTNKATVETGSGGMVAGAAGTATTRDDVTTVAELLNSSAALRRIYSGDTTVTASHTSNFSAQVLAIQAAAIGFSGAFARNTVNTPATVNIGGGLRLNALGDILITASNTAANNNSYARGGGGGVFNGQAVESSTSLTSATTVNVGESTWLSANGDPMLFPGKIEIEAWNRYDATSGVRMSAGGLFQGGGAKDGLTSTITNTINIGRNAVLFSVGQIQVGTTTVADINSYARAEMWGLFGGAGAETDIHYNSTQAVTVANGARLEAYDLITVNVGKRGDASMANRISINAHTDVYNNTVIPMTLLARGTAAADNQNTLTIELNTQILGVGSVALGAYEGAVALDGTGRSYNPYLTIFSRSDSDDNNERFETARVILDGTVKAGIHAQQVFNISEAGVITRGDTSNNPLVQISAALLDSVYISAEANNVYYALGTAFPQAEAQQRIADLLVQRATATGAALDQINGQLTALQAIVGTLATGPVTTIAFGKLFASGGDIDVRSTSLGGNGSLTAYGAAQIRINHDSPQYLAMSNMVIANTQGGQIQFAGAGTASATMTVTEGDKRTSPQITINANYQASRAINDPPDDPPLIMLRGVVSNQNGNVAIFNKFGDLSVFNAIDAASLNINLPNGRLVVDLGDKIFSSAGSIASILQNYMVRPMTPTELVYYAANADFNYDGRYTTAEALSRAIYDSPNTQPNWNAQIVTTLYLGILNTVTAGTGTCITADCRNVGTPHIDRLFDVIPVRSLAIEGAYDPNRIVRGTPLIRAGQVFITADIIDVNGQIIAGRVDNSSISLDAAVATQIAGFKTAYTQGNGTRFEITQATVVNPGDQLIKATYDAPNDQIVLNKVTSGVSGYVYLNGNIVSSNTYGNIQVYTGYSNVTIDNTTGTTISTSGINAGQAVPGVVQIVDRAGGGFNQNAFNTTTTWYVYTPGSATPLSIYTAAGSSLNDYTQATRVGSAQAGSSATYSPLTNVGMSWIEVAQLKRTFSTGSNGLPSWSATEWQWDLSFAPGLRTDRPYIQDRAYIDIVPAGQAYFREDIGISTTGGGIVNNYNGNNGVTVNDVLFNIKTGILVNLYSTVRADFPIAVQFNSNGIGSVTINSNAAVKVGGAIDNATGLTSITAPRILQGDGGLTGGNSINLQATNGIGTASTALAVSLKGGALTASTASGDINMAAIGGLKLNTVSAPGNVWLSATNDIVSAGAMNIAGTPNVSGKNISLSTTGGAIGAVTTIVDNNPTPTSIQPLVLQATPATLPGGEIDGGVINADATTAIYLVQKNGDFRVGTVSANGAVFLMAAGQNGQPASIVNGVSRAQTSATAARLADVWADLDLVNNDGTAAVSAYESVVNRNFQEYLQFTKLMTMLDSGNAADRTAALNVIKAQRAAATGESVGSISDPNARAYAEGRVTSLTSYLTAPTSTFNASNPTTAWVTQALSDAIQARDATFRYTLPTDTAVYANLTSGAQWQLSQLQYSINTNAISGGSAPATSLPTPNISGSQVMLYAPGGSIGSTAPSLSATFTSVDASTLTNEMKAKLTLAGPGDLKVTTTTLAGGVTQYMVDLKQTDLVVADANGPVSVKAQSNIYLGGSRNIVLGGADAALFPALPSAIATGAQVGSGEVRIDAAGSILNGAPNQTVIFGNVSLLNLTAGGSIGLAGAGNAIIASLMGGGAFDSGRAANGIYFRQNAGDLIVGNLFGGNSTNGVIQLAATGSIYAEPQFTDRTVPHILGKSLDLRADSGDIGYNSSSFQPLQVSLIGGALTGNALGKFALLSPAESLTVGTAGVLGGVTAGSLLTLSATGGDLTVTRSLVGPDSISLTANGTLTIAAGTPSAPVTVSSTSGGVTILAGVLAMQADTGIAAATDVSIVTTGALTATTLTSATGNIFASADGDASFGSVGVTAATGSQTITLKSTGGALTVASVSGPGAIELDASANLTVGPNGQVTSRDSTITVSAGTLDMQAGSQLTAATGIHIETTGALVAKALTTAAGDIFALAGGNAAFTTASITATTGSNAITLTSTAGALSLDGAAAQGTITLEAAGIATVNPNGQVTSRTGDVAVTAGALDMKAGSQLTAAGRIGVTTRGDAIVGRLVSQLDPGVMGGPAIAVAAGTPTVAGAILGNGDGQINLTTVRPNAAVLLVATNGIGTSARPLKVDVPAVSATATGGGIYIDAIGDVRFPVLAAPNGDTQVNATGILTLGSLSGADVHVSSGGDLDIGTITATNSLTVTAKTFTATIVQAPAATAPLILDITGPNGGIAQKVTLNIDAPSTEFRNFLVTDATVTTTGTHFGIDNGFVPGKLVLTVSGQTIVLDNRSPVPTGSASVQMYGPGQYFYFDQNGRSTYTSNFIVSYGENAAPIALSLYPGGSFVRDLPRDMQLGEVFDIQSAGKGSTFYIIGVSPAFMLDAAVLPKAVDKTGEGPAVNF